MPVLFAHWVIASVTDAPIPEYLYLNNRFGSFDITPFFPLFYFILFKRCYLFIHEREREAETQAEGEAGSMQGA